MTDVELKEFERMIHALAEVRSLLNHRSQEFLDDMTARFEEHGGSISVSRGQWNYLESLCSQYT